MPGEGRLACAPTGLSATAISQRQLCLLSLNTSVSAFKPNTHILAAQIHLEL
jgi:hypothetical protein